MKKTGFNGLLATAFLLPCAMLFATEEAPKTSQEVGAALEKRGGRVYRDRKQRGTPIVEVSFSQKKPSNDDLALLSMLPQLKKLSLLECNITDDGMKRLSPLVNLEELDLEGNVLSDKGLEAIEKLTKLRRLTLSVTDITDAGLNHLKEMKSLRILRIRTSKKITDRVMAHLSALENLEELDLSGDSIAGSGLVHLGKLTKLKELALRHNKIRNAELVYLKEMKSLSHLDLTGNADVIKKGIDDLKKALPKTDIDHD